jgi:hypothetical protein
MLPKSTTASRYQTGKRWCGAVAIRGQQTTAVHHPARIADLSTSGRASERMPAV